MNITRDNVKGLVVLRCVGRLDATTSIQMEQEINSLLDSEICKVMIDFCGIDYMSSAGMRVLLSMTKRLRNKGGKLSIFAIHEEVREIISMAGFEKVLAIYATEEEAIKAYDEKMA